MTDLSVIKDFIQTVTEAITHSLEIESQVVDSNLVTIAGTVKEKSAVPDGLMRKAIDRGVYYFCESPKKDLHCLKCRERYECRETASLGCPIFLDGKAIGVMALRSNNYEQREKLIAKKESLLSFISGMCELISSRLKEHEMLENEHKMLEEIEVHNIMLNQILNTVSDGYIIINNECKITNINKYALKILSTTERDVKNKVIDEVIPDIDLKGSLSKKGYTSYDEIIFRGTVYGIFITTMEENGKNVGALISFKKVDKISSRVYSKAFQDKEITFDNILGKSKAIYDAKELAMTVADYNASILLLGESGTGKELFARAIHYHSSRCNSPFISVNCAAIPEELLESELFGYEAGSFTGANKTGKPGKFEIADKGTILLDEIGDMPFYLQAKLLRVLQDKAIERVGSLEQKQVDVRIIAATNKNLDKMVKEGKFREDLYYRLNVIPINIPPLRQRRGDIELLVEYFLNEYSKRFHIDKKIVSAEAKEIMNSYDWPGNVRELENLVQYLISVGNSKVISADLLPNKLFNKNVSDIGNDSTDTKIVSLKVMEKNAILNALKLYGNSAEGKSKVAKLLGVGRTTLYRKLAEYKEI